jgi:hypothetical protein
MLAVSVGCLAFLSIISSQLTEVGSGVCVVCCGSESAEEVQGYSVNLILCEPHSRAMSTEPECIG